MILAVAKQGKGIETLAGDGIERKRNVECLGDCPAGIAQRDGKEGLDVFRRDDGKPDIDLLDEIELPELALQLCHPVHIQTDGKALAELGSVDLGEELLCHQVAPHVGFDDALIVPLIVTIPSDTLMSNWVRTPEKDITGSVD